MNAPVLNLRELDAAQAQHLSAEIGRLLLDAHQMASPQAMLTALAHAAAGAIYATSDDADHARRQAHRFAALTDLALSCVLEAETAPASPSEAASGSRNDPATWF